MFRYSEFQAFLRHALSFGEIFPLRDWHGQPGLILRQDVDLDVLPAYQLAKVEAEIGVRSTFFFLTTSDFYNIAADRNRRMLREMAHEGFEIALHFDPLVYPGADADALAKAARHEGEHLSEVVGVEVVSVSLHNPSVHGQYILLEGWINAYDPRIFDPAIYMSDSRMILRSDPYSFVAEIGTQTRQFLAHPMHYGDDTQAYPRPMIEWVQRSLDSLHSTFSVNSTYMESIEGDLIRHVVAALQRTGD